MISNTVARVALAAALVITIPSAATAQAEPASPEGDTWHLSAYAAEGDLVDVPWFIDPTLTLEGGQASGSTGCNDFSGSYTLDGEMLTFEAAFAMTLKACPEDEAAVETSYMANLPQTATWAITDDVLQLADADGAVILEYEQAAVALTPSDISAIVARFDAQQALIERVDERVDNIRIGVLRDRIKELETQVSQLRSQGSSSSGGGGGGSAFTAAEKVLLKGIPARIRKTCVPRRSQNPAGTLAAVQCSPDTAVVRDMAYYLMAGDDASTVFETRMNTYGVTDGNTECWNGKPSLRYYTPGPDVDGCYVNEDGRANVRAVVNAAGCSQLKVNGSWVDDPALYVAILGEDSNIKKLWRWAWDGRYGDDTFTRTIKAPANAPNASRCPT